MICAAMMLLLAGLTAVPALGQNIVNSWEGIRGPDPAGLVGPPPDTHGAPGPSGVLATVNLAITYFTKTGTSIWGPVALPATFFPGNTGVGNQNADPKVVFDHDSRRFFVIMQEDHNSRFWLNVAVSRSSDPRSSGAADWITYRLDATEYTTPGTFNSAGGVNYGGDYPALGVDAQALYVTYNMYGFLPSGVMSGCGCDSPNAALLIMNKSQLINGTGNLSSLYFNKDNSFPVTPFGGSPGNVMYLVRVAGAASVEVVSVSDPLGARTVNSQLVPVTDLGNGPTNEAPQLGSANTIDPIDGRTLGNASLAVGDVWFCATRGQPNGQAVAAYYRLRLNGWPSSGSVTKVEDGTVGESNYWNFCPAIGVNRAGDACMTWTLSSASTYPTMMVATRSAGDSAFGVPQIVKASTAPNNDGRWGDFATVWPDPNDGSLWIAHEWTRSDTGTWSTWWAQVQTPAYDFYVDNTTLCLPVQLGTPGCPFLTVALAVNASTHGTIHIAPHHYNEALTINKAVTLTTYNGSPAVIGAP